MCVHSSKSGTSHWRKQSAADAVRKRFHHVDLICSLWATIQLSAYHLSPISLFHCKVQRPIRTRNCEGLLGKGKKGKDSERRYQILPNVQELITTFAPQCLLPPQWIWLCLGPGGPSGRSCRIRSGFRRRVVRFYRRYLELNRRLGGIRERAGEDYMIVWGSNLEAWLSVEEESWAQKSSVRTITITILSLFLAILVAWSSPVQSSPVQYREGDWQTSMPWKTSLVVTSDLLGSESFLRERQLRSFVCTGYGDGHGICNGFEDPGDHRALRFELYLQKFTRAIQYLYLVQSIFPRARRYPGLFFITRTLPDVDPMPGFLVHVRWAI